MFCVQRIEYGANLSFSPDFSENSVYVLFDPGNFEQKHRNFMNVLKSSNRCSLFADLPEDEYKSLRPMLFTISSHQQWEDLIRVLKEQIPLEQFRSFMFIESSITDIYELQKHIKHYLTGRLKNGRIALVRLYDPIVFLRLQNIWPEDGIQEFWRPFLAWHIWDDIENIAITFRKDINNA